MSGFDAHLGEVMALSAAIVWAFAVILFKKSGESVHPIGLNLVKNLLAVTLFIPTAWLFGESLLLPASTGTYLMFLASGALGIGLADTFFFKSLNSLGAGLSAIVDCLYSPSIIGLSIIWLGESLSTLQLFGVVLIVSAVLTILVEKHTTVSDRRQIYWGVFWGAMAMFTMAIGIVMIKPLLTDAPLIWATQVRLVGGLAVLFLMLLVHPARKKIIDSARSTHRWGYTISGSFMGGYLSMILWLAGMKYTQASTAAALNQTSNVFVFIFAALILKEKITIVRMAAIALGVSGALLVTFG